MAVKVPFRIDTPQRRRLLRVVAVAGGIVLGAWSMVTVHAVVRTDGRIEATAIRIAELAPWSATGTWLAEATKVWEPTLDENYDRLFPDRIGREDLYLELATIAGDCGIEDLSLSRTVSWDPLAQEDDESDLSGGDPLLDEFAPIAGDLPTTELAEHRLELAFVSDYEAMTHFVESLSRVSRAITIDKLHTGSIPEGLSVHMELIFYVQDADQSR